MSEYVGSRFGQDMPARIAGSTVVLIEATDILPGEPMYQPLIPFYPGGVVSGSDPSGSLAAAAADLSWERTPTDFPITFWEGDDMVIPLYIQDPNNPDLDMSDQSQWEWHAQIRLLASYTSTLITEFSVDSQYFAPGTYDPLIGTTLVSLFLPRELNTHAGSFSWELYSISPMAYSDEFAKPDDWPDDEVWPPTTTLRTWLQGDCTIKLRTAATDALPVTSTPWTGNFAVAAVNAGPFVVGPNGRVP
jgi:hypothetical protein